MLSIAKNDEQNSIVVLSDPEEYMTITSYCNDGLEFGDREPSEIADYLDINDEQEFAYSYLNDGEDYASLQFYIEDEDELTMPSSWYTDSSHESMKSDYCNVCSDDDGEDLDDHISCSIEPGTSKQKKK